MTTTPSPALLPLSDADRQTVRECADLFFSEPGTVHDSIARVAFAAFRAGRACIAQASAGNDSRECNPHPDAPHGFNRNASHTEDRYVCDCEGWEPSTSTAGAEQPSGLIWCPGCGEGVLDFCRGEPRKCVMGLASPPLPAPAEQSEKDSCEPAEDAQAPQPAREQRLKATMERMDKEGPLPGMIAAFENHFGASWTDADWRIEARTWAAAWRLAREARESGVSEPVDQPMAWYEAEESCRGMPLHILLSPNGVLCHSAKWHWGPKQPSTSNPTWPLFGRPQPGGDAARLGRMSWDHKSQCMRADENGPFVACSDVVNISHRHAALASGDAVREALKMAIRQNSHDMLMTGEEIRQFAAALAGGQTGEKS